MKPKISYLFLILFFLACQGGKAPTVAEQIPLETSVTGSVQTVTAQTSDTPFDVTLFNENGETIAETRTDEKGGVQIIIALMESQSGFFRIVASRTGDPFILEAAIPVHAGQKGELPIEITPATTLALLLANALNARLKRGAEFYTPFVKSLDPALVETALAELQRIANREITVGEANALQEIIRQFFIYFSAP